MIYKKVRTVIYVTLKKALYGYLRSALLLYERLAADIRYKRFELSPYNPCGVNKMIEGKQVTIFWHMGDLKVSHADPKEVTKFMSWLEGIHRQPRITMGKLHKYLGMALDFRNPVELPVTMVYYLKGVLEYFLELVTGRSTILSANYLFLFRPEDDRNLLDKEWATSFRRKVEQLLFVTLRARKDIKMDIAFLCNQVRSPDGDYWGNIVRVIRYIRGTLHIPLISSSIGGLMCPLSRT